MTLLMIKPYSRYLELISIINRGENLIIVSDELDISLSFTNKLIEDSKVSVSIAHENNGIKQRICTNSQIYYIGFTGELSEQDLLEISEDSGKSFLYVIESTDSIDYKILLNRATQLGLSHTTFFSLRDISFKVVNISDGFGDIFIRELK